MSDLECPYYIVEIYETIFGVSHSMQHILIHEYLILVEIDINWGIHRFPQLFFSLLMGHSPTENGYPSEISIHS